MTHEDLLKENLSETFEFVFKFSLMFPRKLVREKGKEGIFSFTKLLNASKNQT